MSRGRHEDGAGILYGQTAPRNHHHHLSQSDIDDMASELLRPEADLPQVFKKLDVKGSNLHSFLSDTPFGIGWPSGLPDQFRTIPVFWTTATYDMIVMRGRHRSMTEQPTKNYADDTQFFALKEMAALAGRRGFTIIGAQETANDEGFLTAMATPATKTPMMFIMKFAIVNREAFADGTLEPLGIGRAW